MCGEDADTGANRFDTADPDKDCDGYPASVDCDDSNCFVYPNAPREYNNGRDDDCDGVADQYYGCGDAGLSGLPLFGGVLVLVRRRRRRRNPTGDPTPGSATMGAHGTER